MVESDTAAVRSLLEDLFPICRSLTGDGNRVTLDRLSEVTPLNVHEVPSGTPVYDWEVPPEWNIRTAYIKDSDGNTVVDFEENNLHVLNYSAPVDRTVSYEELVNHVHTLPEMPGAVPYRTSYYEREWGFCLRHRTLEAMDEDDTYEVYVDSDIDPGGSLTYADATVEGESDSEFVISTYCCHPSLANDNLSGLVLSTLLFERLRERSTHHSYRLVVVPETVGAVTYLHENKAAMKRVDGGFVVTCVAGPGGFDLKESFLGDHPVDLAGRWALSDREYDCYPFVPDGSDERQYSSPGFRIPTVTVSKDKYYEYDEYHTSYDDLSFISADALLETLDVYWTAISLLEMNRTYERTEPHGEFKLDRYALHPTTGGQKRQPGALEGGCHEGHEYAIGDGRTTEGAFLDGINWLMFGCDGDTSLFELAVRADLDVRLLYRAATRLEDAGLLMEIAE